MWKAKRIWLQSKRKKTKIERKIKEDEKETEDDVEAGEQSGKKLIKLLRILSLKIKQK